MTSSRVDEKVYCRKCKVKTNHGIITTYENESIFPYDEYYWKHSYYTVQCLGCDTIAFVSQYHDESMKELDGFGEMRYFSDVKVYPEEPRAEKYLKYEPHRLQDFNESPESIQMMYSQIVSAFNMESYLLAAVGLRMLVEGICIDLKIQNGYVLDENGNRKLRRNSTDEVRSSSLEGKINGLVAKNLVIQPQANILHRIREIGNASAHELQVPRRKTVKMALEIIERIIEQIYQLHNYVLK